MFKRIAIAVDGRARCEDAVRLARDLGMDRVELTLVHVYEAVDDDPIFGDAHFVEEAREHADWVLEVAGAAAAVPGRLSVGAATVGDGLRLAVHQLGADLVVLGSTHHGAAGRVLLGGHTRDAMRVVPCAVAVAPPGYRNGIRRIETVGVGYDEQPETDVALALAREVAAHAGASLSVLDVLSLPAYLYYGLDLYYEALEPEIQGAVRARLGRIRGADAHVAFGDPVEQLVGYSGTVDLLVLGSHTIGASRTRRRTSTPVRLAHLARCPLLVTPTAGFRRRLVMEARVAGLPADSAAR